jgi:hypothetical protein
MPGYCQYSLKCQRTVVASDRRERSNLWATMKLLRCPLISFGATAHRNDIFQSTGQELVTIFQTHSYSMMSVLHSFLKQKCRRRLGLFPHTPPS